MNLLYVCGTYVPSHGGAEISMHTLLKELQRKRGVKVSVVTDKRYTDDEETNFYEEVPLIGTTHENRVYSLQKAIQAVRPDIILTQLMWSDVALNEGNLAKIPTIFRACKIPFHLDISNSSRYAPAAIISTSESVRKYVGETFRRESTIISPPISFDKSLIPKESFIAPFERKYITMFNPLGRKGGIIFKELAKEFQNKSFAVVPGWTSLKENANSDTFSSELIKRICESLGSEYSGKNPKYVDFNDCKNVDVLEPREDVWRIYASTRILLVPSQWEEAFGRVAVEGMTNGIPTMASNVGGLKEAIGSGGILIDDYKNFRSWAEEIICLDKRDYYDSISQRCQKAVKNEYSLDGVVKQTLGVFRDAMNRENIGGQLN